MDNFGVRVLPAFRPDKGVEIQNEAFSSWVSKLEDTIGRGIHSFEDYLIALENRVNYFHDRGCRLSDHGLEYVPYREAGNEKLEEIFMKGRKGEEITREEGDAFRTAVLLFLGRLYAKLNWAMQLHIGAIRNNNTRMYKLLGPDTGFDSIHDHNIAYGLSLFRCPDRMGCFPEPYCTLNLRIIMS